jgi:hypothetical protein
VLQLVLFDSPDLRDPGEGLLTLLPPSGLPHVQILQNRKRRIIKIIVIRVRFRFWTTEKKNNFNKSLFGLGLSHSLLPPWRLPQVQILQNRKRRII